LESGFVPVPVSALLTNLAPGFDLYLRTREGMVLYCAKNVFFTEEMRGRLASLKARFLYFPVQERAGFMAYASHHLRELVKRPDIPLERKAEMLYEASCTMLHMLLRQPSPEQIQQSLAIADAMTDYLPSDPVAFRQLVMLTSYDYYTYTHSVNVCAYASALAQRLAHHSSATRDAKQFVHDIATAALLHDIGKSRVPDTILNKPSKLDESEWEVIHNHPIWGEQLLREAGMTTEPVLAGVRSHHEQASGHGYPDGRKLENIPLSARIVAIADVFDAMTTRRAYKDAMRGYEVLKLMQTSLGHHFDQNLLRQFVLLWAAEDSALQRKGQQPHE